MNNPSDDLRSFLEATGALHDAAVTNIYWAPAKRTLRLKFDDIYSNFEGLSDYPGAVPGTIELRGIEHIKFNLDTSEGHLNVYEFTIEPGASSGWHASISFWPSGRIDAVYDSAVLNQKA